MNMNEIRIEDVNQRVKVVIDGEEMDGSLTGLDVKKKTYFYKGKNGKMSAVKGRLVEISVFSKEN